MSELSSIEYQRFYDTGELPERVFDSEAERLRREYLGGEIDLSELEDGLSYFYYEEEYA